MPDLLGRIRDEIRTFSGRSLRESAAGLLGVLGYRSDRLPAVDGMPEFLDLCENEGKLTETQLASFDKWSDVQAVFQFTEDELRAHEALGVAGFEKSRAESFLFMAVQLRDGEYARGRLADMTRNVNRVFAMPVIVIYRYRGSGGANVFTVAVVHRRAHKRDPTRDVLERVTLVKDVREEDPHRAHIDILAGLALEKLSGEQERWSFDQLHAAWESALDTEPLNRRFYRQLFDWFERACREGEWPPDAPGEQQVIRCITRVLFVWFIKEKGLVSEDWFKRERMEELLRKLGGSDYYRAVLQNLFFATLNAPSEQRAWSTRTRDSHRVFSRWRYRSLIRDIEGFEALMARTPFINGGLFDCLDDEESESSGGKRVDMFSDPDPAHGPAAQRARGRAWKFLNVPDELFFDDRGLFTLLNRFKFTVKENTPVETEVALDPELLGKVFEHLLAAYNPETRDTARRQTGSYYTPRPVVDYMVDEALVIALVEKAQPEDGDADFWRERLRYLLDYEDAGDLFEEEDTEAVVRGIADLKVLDPAVGSGAFPMAVLSKLTLALRRLDPENELWRELQREAATQRSTAAYETRDPVERENELIEISRTFQRYSDDFGRKLYLIQNSIYGADIQAIACQIAKLRFFISLAIEQEPDPAAPNQGIKPLPNLETRFVAADALLELQRERTLSSESERVRALERQLVGNRERHFHANSRQAKLDCMTEDRRLRTHLAGELEALGFPTDTAEQVARWDPYDQNKVAPWFDAEYMFGAKAGFDVIIGNPPYIQLQKDGGKLRKLYKDVGYATYASTGDIYGLFFEKGCRLLRSRGALAYITSNSWLRARYGERLREYFDRRHTPLRLIDMGKDVFDAVVDASVLVLRSGGKAEPFPGVDIDRIHDAVEFPPPAPQWAEVRPNRTEPWSILTNVEWRVMEKMKANGTPLKDWADIAIYRGILTGYNKAFLVDDSQRKRLISEDPTSAEILKPILRGRDIRRYRARWAGLWLIATHNGFGDVPAVRVDEYPAVRRHLDQFYNKLEKRYDKGSTPYNLRSCAYHAEFSKSKVFWMDMSPRGRFAYSDEEVYCNDKAYFMTGRSLKWCCAILNSHLVTWMIGRTARTTGAGLTQWQKFVVETIPVPSAPTEQRRPIVERIDRLLRLKETGSKADAADVESQLNRSIYTLYGLTEKEIEFVTASIQR
ncbi:Eco57I restriction-modification methylase domain-containing protein [Candidatus Palauibacter sp.]|uniref:Eco57I restriction-modification methylase domain-containing protein n=1 Tax=Candidatus Palauibacter sp. TaxID=3101350 RepID=UPI003B5C22FF